MEHAVRFGLEPECIYILTGHTSLVKGASL